MSKVTTVDTQRIKELRLSYLSKPNVWYVYPLWHKVSFTLVAQNYVKYLKPFYRLYEIDELAIFSINPHSNPTVILHPYFFMVTRDPKRFIQLKGYYKSVIGIDVADSDRISQGAVILANYSDAIVVPSNWSKQAYIRSGVRVPIYVVPHGLSEEYYKPPRPSNEPIIRELRLKKRKNNLIYVLFILMHSGERKGAHLVYEVLKEIQKMYKNVYLVLKVGWAGGYHFELLKQLRGFYFSKWLSETEMVNLYDTCDIYTMFSIGGGFEIPAIESLSRGVVVLACDRGSWTDYLPDFLLIPHGRYVPVFPKANPLTSIHCGGGYEINVEKAIDKMKDVIENLEEYKAKVREYWEKVKHRWTWKAVSLKLKEVIDKYTQ